MYTHIFCQTLSSTIKFHLLASNTSAVNFLFLVKTYDVADGTRQ